MNLENQKEMFLEPLRDQIWQAAQEMDVNLTAEELRVAMEGPKTEEENWVPFKLGDRASSFSLRAKESSKTSLERREAGAQSLVLKAASYLRGAPDFAANCLEYAYEVWKGEDKNGNKILWNEEDVPQFPIQHPEVITEEREQKAA